ncbi:hypothetical protein SDC9_60373 [bioreactor metagenome]|uniref:Uncharacterized protein n=1 Tax=bioreactor metagenome TaxID=1076179 RepID=A0A644XIH9_9ZZZZ
MPRDEIIHFLDAEILSVRADIQRPGWTKWAIWGSLGTLTWILLEQLENPKHSPNIIFFLIIAGSFLFDLISSYLKLTENTYKDNLRPNRFFDYSIHRNWRAMSVLGIFKHFGLLYLTHLISPILPLRLTLCSYLCNIAFLVIYVINFVLTFFHNPVGTHSTEPGWKFNLIFSLLFFSGLFFIGQTALKFASSPTILVDLRIAGLVLILVQLAITLTRLDQDSPTLQKLVEIRRDLILNQISEETASNQIEELLLGLQSSTVIQEKTEHILHESEKIEKHLQQITEYLESFETYCEETPDHKSQEFINEAKLTALKISGHLNKIIFCNTSITMKINDIYRYKKDPPMKGKTQPNSQTVPGKR